jgi:uncharacterized protein (TIGR03118 family)
MRKQNNLLRWALAVMTVLFVMLRPLPIHAASGYIQHNLVSDVPLLADLTDPNLVNPWGNTPPNFWVCDNRTGLSTVYSNSTSTGTVSVVSTIAVPIPPPASRPSPGGTCTGIVFNTTAGAFTPAPGVNAGFIFATQDGTISARTTGNAAVLKVDNSASGAVYDGLAIFNSASANFLYAANFHAGTIDVFDTTYAKATLPGSFTDPSVPAGFAPFNIQNLGGKLYVTYAKQDATKTIDVAGVGNGYVAVFDTNGNLLQHLISGGPLNSPWGVAIAPPNFGPFANDLLVGNFEDGLINAFNPSTGAFLGTMQDPAGNPIANPGLWALQVGAGGGGGFPNTLYILAGISVNGSGLQSHGLFAAIYTTAPPAANANGIVNNASYAAGALAPGSLAAIFGANLTEGISACIPPACTPTFRADKRLNATLAGAQVEINGVPAPILAASPIQLVVQIPAELSAGASAKVQVTVAGQSSTPSTISIGAAFPGIFSTAGSGSGPGVITHANGTLVNATSPAVPGETVTIYVTGLGQTSPAVPTGEVPSGTVSIVAAPIVTIDGLPATVQTSGLNSATVGLNQIVVVVPSGVHTGTNVNVVVTSSGQTGNTVTMATGAATP